MGLLKIWMLYVSRQLNVIAMRFYSRDTKIPSKILGDICVSYPLKIEQKMVLNENHTVEKLGNFLWY